jgi:hypothetical protein
MNVVITGSSGPLGTALPLTPLGTGSALPRG